MRALGAYAQLTLGAAITALGLNFFLVPNRLNDGGVTGLAVVAHYLWGLPVGAVIAGLNLPLVLLGGRLLGMRFGLQTLYGILALSFWVEVLRVPALTRDPLLAAVYGGAMSGLGLGLVFRVQGSTGGTDIVARLLSRYSFLTVGQGLLAADFVVMALTGAALTLRVALYSLLALFVSSRVVDLLQEGLDYSRAVWIVSERSEELARGVLEGLGRGATAFTARGMYTGRPREVLLVVVARSEMARLKELVRRTDPGAFMVVGDVHEVLGEGFRPHRGLV